MHIDKKQRYKEDMKGVHDKTSVYTHRNIKANS